MNELVYRTLSPKELYAWADHCQAVFTGEADGYFLRHFEYDPSADVSLVFVAMDGDTIAGTLRVFQRHIWLDGRAVAMGGIGEVSTKPEYRRRGIAAKLLDLAIDAMTERGMQVSMLYGDQPIYEKAGWRFCSVPMKKVPVQALPALGPSFEVRDFAAADLDTIMGIYDLFAGRMDGAIIRDSAYWRQWVLPQWQPPQVLMLDGHIVAYCCARSNPQEKSLFVAESGSLPEYEDMLAPLYRHIATIHQCENVRVNASSLPGYDTMLTQPGEMMMRLNIPFEGISDSDALVARMQNAGCFYADHF